LQIVHRTGKGENPSLGWDTKNTATFRHRLPVLDYGTSLTFRRLVASGLEKEAREKRKEKEIVMTESRVSGNVDGESLSVSRL